MIDGLASSEHDIEDAVLMLFVSGDRATPNGASECGMRALLLAWVWAFLGMPGTVAAQSLTPVSVPSATAPVDQGNTLIEAKRIVAAAERSAIPWTGPRTGPQAQAGKHIAIVAEDLRNGGILGVIDGAVEAAKANGWSVKISLRRADARLTTLAKALASRPDGLIVVGGDAHALLPGYGRLPSGAFRSSAGMSLQRRGRCRARR